MAVPATQTVGGGAGIERFLSGLAQAQAGRTAHLQVADEGLLALWVLAGCCHVSCLLRDALQVPHLERFAEHLWDTVREWSVVLTGSPAGSCQMTLVGTALRDVAA